MKRFQRLIVVIILATLLLSSGSHITSAQDGGNTAQFIRQVLSDLGTNCASLEHNSGCYGYQQVQAAFLDAVEDDFFSEPADRTDLTSLVTIAGSEMNVKDEIWGISILKVQANIHNALPDDHLILLSLGDITLENAVEPETALLPLEPVIITSIADAPLYKAPDVSSEQPAIATTGTSLAVDATNPDGQWLRTVYNDGERNWLAWVSIQSVDQTVDLSSLPVIDSDTYAPMQKFFLRGGSAHPGTVPSVLLMQGPADTDVDIMVNGAPIRISSTIVLRVLPNGKSMRLITLFGMATINPDTPNEFLVPPGFFTDICLSDPDDYGGLNGDKDDQIVSCDWSGRKALTQGDLNDLAMLAELPENVVNYPIEIPTIAQSSGVGRAFERFYFHNPNALKIAKKFCDQGKLPEEICRYLFD